MRAPLVAHIYGNASFLALAATTVQNDWTGDLANAKVSFPSDVQSVTRLRAPTPRNGLITSHLCYPTAPARNRLVAMFSGHETNGYLERCATITQELLQDGYHVLGIDMPIYGNCATQSYQRLNGTPVTIDFTHNYTALVDDGASGLRMFIDGAIGCINTALSLLGLARYDATGISGGGWAIDYISAIDPRCRRSYPVFNSLPFHIRDLVGAGTLGDWEQLRARPWWFPGILNGSYVCLYALGCIDSGRKRTQYLGLNDTVFPINTVQSQVAAYAAQVDALVPAGNHELVVDTTAVDHVYSPETVADIVGDLNANP